MKIGVYGGSFNPCHLMHKKLVLTLLQEKIFDKIVILPTGNFYKKNSLLKGEERIKMLNLMFEGDNRVSVCDYEFKNNLICTYRSLDFLANLFKGDKIYFILGSDNFISFKTWKRYEYILDNYNLLVIKRKGIDITEVLNEFNKYKGEIKVLDLNLDNISSSYIRNELESGHFDSVCNLLDLKVFNYIKQRGFYQPNYKEEVVSRYISDEEFLKTYNSDSYEKMSITADITLFSVSDILKNNYRSINQKAFSILLVKRNTPPFMGKWCLPGGFLSLDETLEDCAKRVLVAETNLDNIYLEQLYTFSNVDRDIRTRVLSASYFGLVDKNNIKTRLNDNALFFNITLNEENDYITINFKSDSIDFSCKVKKIINKYGIVTYEEIENDFLAFDNLIVIMTSIKRLQSKIKYTDIVFNMMPKKFTFKELQLVFESILGRKILDPVFRRSMKDKIIKLEEVKIDGGHRPAYLYMYKGDKDNG